MPYEAQDVYEGEFDEMEGEYEQEFDEGEGEFEGEQESESPFDEATEMDLAGELLDITGEGELDQFLGDLARKAVGVAGRFVRSPTGQQLVGVLRGAAKKALPGVGAAIGGRIAGPTGARIGGQLAQAAGRYFGLELEGLSPEDQEFEVARRFVRFAGSAVRRHARRPGVSPIHAYRWAARRHAPGLLRHPHRRRYGYGYRRPGYWRRPYRAVHNRIRCPYCYRTFTR